MCATLLKLKKMLAAIWSTLDVLRQEERDAKISLKEPVDTLNFCECGGRKLQVEGMPTCTACGKVDKIFVDDSAEWKSGISSDGQVTDGSRCANPNAPSELFSYSWGKSSIIGKKRGSTYKDRRMAKINFHLSMSNHRDRALFHVYREIEETCPSLPENILHDAKTLYKKFNDAKLTRGSVRTGIKANCVLFACRFNKYPRSTKEIADMFQISTKDVSRTTQIFTETLMGTRDAGERSFITRPVDLVPRLMNRLECTQEDRQEAQKYVRTIQDYVELMAKTPLAVAAAGMYTVLKARGFTKAQVARVCDVSVPTLNKVESLLRNKDVMNT